MEDGKWKGLWRMENSINNEKQFYFFLDTGKVRTMYSKSDNVKIMMGFEADDTINEFFEF